MNEQRRKDRRTYARAGLVGVAVGLLYMATDVPAHVYVDIFQKALAVACELRDRLRD